MLTKGKTSKFRIVKYAAMMLALIAVFALCLTACGKAAPVSAEYVTGTLTKSVYNLGDTFDCTGAQIKVTYDNDTTETVDVTAAMVGEVKLSTVGAATVSVTYSSKGGAITATIPVTVLDPLTDERNAAIEKINANATVVANANDAGVKALLSEYADLIKKDGTSADIAKSVSTFETKVQEYVDAKADAIADVQATGERQIDLLVDVFKSRASTALTNASTSIKAAASIDEINDIVSAFNTELANILAEQKVWMENFDTPITPDEMDPGLLKDKTDLTKAIRQYIKHIESIKADVLAYGKDTAKETYVAKYDAAVEDLSFWSDYILATPSLDVAALREYIEEIYKKAIRTPFDEIYEALKDVLYNEAEGAYTEDVLKDGVGITVVPGEYPLDEVTGNRLLENVTGTDKDAIYTLILGMAANYQEYATIFGDELAEKNVVAYQIYGTNVKISLTEYAQVLSEAYEAIVEIQTEAKAVIAAIEAIAAAADDAAKSKAIADAWATLKTWGMGNGVFSCKNSDDDDTNDVEYYNDLVFNKSYDGIFNVIEADETEGKAPYRYEFSAKDYDKDFMIQYFVPNYDALIKATVAEDIKTVEGLVDNIPDYIIYYPGNPIDAQEAITEADNARKDFIEIRYNYDTYKAVAPFEGDVDLLLKKITDAQAAYDERKAMALEINNTLIPALKAAAETADKIVIGHYEEGENPVLKAAYDKYVEFSKLNKDATTNYTQPITEEAYLVDCVEAYVELAYINYQHVDAQLEIYAVTKGITDKISDNQATLRKEIKDLADTHVAVVFAMEYNEAINDMVKTKYNLIEILNANKAAVEDYVNNTALVAIKAMDPNASAN